MRSAGSPTTARSMARRSAVRRRRGQSCSQDDGERGADELAPVRVVVDPLDRAARRAGATRRSGRTCRATTVPGASYWRCAQLVEHALGGGDVAAQRAARPRTRPTAGTMCTDRGPMPCRRTSRAGSTAARRTRRTTASAQPVASSATFERGIGRDGEHVAAALVALVDQSVRVAEVAEVDARGVGLGQDDDLLAGPSHGRGVGEAAEAGDGEAADQHLERVHAGGRRVDALGVAEDVHRAGVELEGSSHGDGLENPAVDVPAAVQQHGREQPRQARGGLEDRRRRAAVPPAGGPVLEVRRDDVQRDSGVAQVAQVAEAGDEAAQRARVVHVVAPAGQAHEGPVVGGSERVGPREAAPDLGQPPGTGDVGARRDERAVEQRRPSSRSRGRDGCLPPARRGASRPGWPRCSPRPVGRRRCPGAPRSCRDARRGGSGGRSGARRACRRATTACGWERGGRPRRAPARARRPAGRPGR